MDVFLNIALMGMRMHDVYKKVVVQHQYRTWIAWASLRPVSLAQWAQFIRDGYFVDSSWGKDLSARRGGLLGDSLLDEVGFSWGERNNPVTTVNWFEAAAYCRWRGGRLPWSRECDELRRGFSNAIRKEWCGEYWNGLFRYPPEINPSIGRLRRLAGDTDPQKPDTERMICSGRSPAIGFRVVFDTEPNRFGIGGGCPVSDRRGKKD